MTLLNPTYLWGLMALLVPIAIHLLNKGDVEVIKVGSIKFLPQSETKQARNIRLNELLLLFLRLIIISLLVLILTGLKFKTEVNKQEVIYVFEPSLIHENSLETYLKELPEGAELRFLTKGFPKVKLEELPFFERNITPNYWQLVDGLEELPADSIVVFSKGNISAVRGIRPSTAAKLNWIVLNEAKDNENWLIAKDFKDSIALIKIKSSIQRTSFETVLLDKRSENFQRKEDSIIIEFSNNLESVRLKGKDSISIGILFEENFYNEAIYFQKAFNVIANYTNSPISIELDSDVIASKAENLNVLVWLKSEQLPITKGKRITYKADLFAKHLVENTSSVNDYVLTKRLTVENVINGNFTKDLLALLDLEKDLKDQLELFDQRAISPIELKPNLIDNKVESSFSRAELVDLSSWVWLALFVFLGVERVLAKLRKQ
ncbi:MULTISPECIES: BatA domain-containing protein [Croceitalea]|uniref:BatA domain-containing protein n=1 Tax=Croceitalea vernalis TaxID=3075599 RepID=A0ABU3BE34_9FLAO|nr:MULTISPECIES: BatA domain-containing protein [unclassified Croceitalea]MDT0538257.1 BatA domain-containing protein [Croceitalea sp. P059]MDT0620041.1 BatA domain-containing protein [Croceitalea sp. P007]